MPSNRRAQRAATAAKDLQLLLQGLTVTQLLQQPPSPGSTSAEQQHLMTQISSALRTLAASLPKDAVSSADMQFPSGLLHYQAAHSAGVLLTLAQQLPEQLAAALQRASVQANTPAGIWNDCTDIKCSLSGVHKEVNSSVEPAAGVVRWVSASLQGQRMVKGAEAHEISSSSHAPPTASGKSGSSMSHSLHLR
jgi:hypothetical protein